MLLRVWPELSNWFSTRILRELRIWCCLWIRISYNRSEVARTTFLFYKSTISFRFGFCIWLYHCIVWLWSVVDVYVCSIIIIICSLNLNDLFRNAYATSEWKKPGSALFQRFFRSSLFRCVVFGCATEYSVSKKHTRKLLIENADKNSQRNHGTLHLIVQKWKCV